MLLSVYFDFDRVFGQIPELLDKLPITLELAFVALAISLIIGLIVAVIRVNKIPVLNQIAKFYLSIIRGTPMIVQLYIAYFGIPIMLRAMNNNWGLDINIRIIPNIAYAFFALGIYQSAYTSETIRASFLAVNKGEIEAAKALGMSYPQILRRIIIPEALEIALPGLINSLIGLIKGTSLAFSCGVVEITAQAKIIAGRTYRNLEGYVALAIIYFVITIIIEQILKIVEKKITIPDQIVEKEDTKFVKFLKKIKNKIFTKNKNEATETEEATDEIESEAIKASFNDQFDDGKSKSVVDVKDGGGL